MPRFRFHGLSRDEKEGILEDLGEMLSEREEIALAIVFESFLKDYPFRDMDIAVYIVREDLDALDCKLELDSELSDRIGYPVNVRILNDAPPWFVKKVIREGRVLIERVPALREKLYLKALDEESLIEKDLGSRSRS